MSDMFVKALLSVLMLIMASCSSSSEPFVDPDLVSPAPISEIQERFLGSSDAAFMLIKDVLEGEGFRVPSDVSYTEGFETSSVSVQDKLCNSTYSGDTPLSCRVRFFVKIRTESDSSAGTVSRIVLRYKETCLDQEHINVSCKDSNGEKLLFKVHRSLSSRL